MLPTFSPALGKSQVPGAKPRTELCVSFTSTVPDPWKKDRIRSEVRVGAGQGPLSRFDRAPQKPGPRELWFDLEHVTRLRQPISSLKSRNDDRYPAPCWNPHPT